MRVCDEWCTGAVMYVGGPWGGRAVAAERPFFTQHNFPPWAGAAGAGGSSSLPAADFGSRPRSEPARPRPVSELCRKERSGRTVYALGSRPEGGGIRGMDLPVNQQQDDRRFTAEMGRDGRPTRFLPDPTRPASDPEAGRVLPDLRLVAGLSRV